MNFGELIKHKRMSAGLSLEEASVSLGYSMSLHIQNWEEGISFPEVDHLKAISRVYNCDADALFECYLYEVTQRIETSLRLEFEELDNEIGESCTSEQRRGSKDPTSESRKKLLNPETLMKNLNIKHQDLLKEERTVLSMKNSETLSNKLRNLLTKIIKD